MYKPHRIHIQNKHIFFLKPIHREWTLRFDTSNIYLPIPNIQQLTEET